MGNFHISDERGRPVTQVQVVEPVKGPWTNSPVYGGGYNKTMPQAAGQTVPVFEMHNDYGSPVVHSILLTSNIQTVSLANSNFRGRLLMGCGAQKKQFDFDWTAGAQFAVVADFIRLTAVTYAPNADVAYSANNNAIQITGAVAKGNVGKGLPLTYTQPIHTYGIAESVDIVIPDFARQLYINVEDNNNPATATNIAFSFVGPGFTYGRDCQLFAGGNARGIAIPAGATKVTVLNGSGAPKQIQPQFILGL